MRNMHDIALQAMDDCPKIKVAFEGVVGSGQSYRVKVRRQVFRWTRKVALL